MVNIDDYINKSFINPYLNSVAFEIRFPASVSIIKDFSEFQDLINDKYPNFAEEVPFLDLSDKIKTSESLRKYLFSDNGEKNKIRLSINALTIITSEYHQFSDFKAQVDDIIKAFSRSFNVENCIRMGLRYINVYSLDSDLTKSISIIKELFIPFYNLELIPIDDVFSNNIEIRKNLTESEMITLRSKLQFNKTKENYEYILDFDVYNYDKTPLVNYESFFVKLRNAEKSEFLRFVTESFIEKMKFID